MLFDLPKQRSNKNNDKLLIQKSKKRAASNKTGGNIIDRIALIKSAVDNHLGEFKNKYLILNEEILLKEYIEIALKADNITIDLETTGLNPMLDKIVGVGIYSDNQTPAYIPVLHKDIMTGIISNQQLNKDIIIKYFKKLEESKAKFIFFNAKFDIRFLRHDFNIYIEPYWDCYIAARILNEIEGDGNNDLKSLYKKYCNPDFDALSFNSLFKDISFANIPIDTAYLYGANDVDITKQLFNFQKEYLNLNHEREDLRGLANIFFNIEMPLINIVADMEDTGIKFDVKSAENLLVDYSKKLTEIENRFIKEYSKFKNKIDAYILKYPNHKLSDPISITSPMQISVLLFDILGLDMPKNVKAKKGSTGEEVLKAINKPITKIILEHREISKLINTYIAKLPKEVNDLTGRIHGSFNQVGADTGRFSSTNPNLQNIPSHNKEIRKLFITEKDYVLLASDYSQQEPRLTAHMSKDKKMIQAYIDDKDLYASVGSIAFNVPYEECLEYRKDGSVNEQGAKRRSRIKAIVLGVCYGKSVPAIAKDLNITTKEAQKIYDKIMKEFPGLKQFMQESEQMAIDLGYVTTVWGRKRRLPKMQLEKYIFSYNGISSNPNFDPLDFDSFEDADEVSDDIITKYTRLLDNCWSYNKKRLIIEQAEKEGINIIDNSGYLAEASRQCVNSRIQGSAADQTKKAMILVGKDKRLKELGFKLLLTVHDELIGECPEKNAKEVSKRFAGLMVKAAEELKVPSKCDVIITKQWYGEPL